MAESAYPLFCPVAMAAEMLEPRWTMLVLCELWSGSTRFSQIQRGVPGMSPGLLSKRLRDLEAKGLVARIGGRGKEYSEYVTTPLADELEPVVRQLGEWAHRNINSEVSLEHLNARLLMWNIRRKINRLELPRHNCVIQFTLTDPPHDPVNYWLVFKAGIEPDLCYSDQGFSVDLFIVGTLRALTSAWMGHTSFDREIADGNITLVGHEIMARSLTRWLVTSSYAAVRRPDRTTGSGAIAAE
ncbi:HxlR family transcriptional regulator [Hoeflea sp. BAL378]|uniref:winged helix-turn-helix transcriptional regulator n=1 Tax=Hoeflea sp. BAL378 TaxID=1547437 RepID=UPI0005135057|nr:helix-turn-helix domain-containing protein [Hoeflea sp. BAL378]KGF67790.1 HxlR family transcriptional regulator [Hoeflea sp. BAL378]